MGSGESNSKEIERVAQHVVDAAFKVHTFFGPGLLESAYEACLAYELLKRGFTVEIQVPLPLIYEEVKFDAGFRIDILVNRRVLIEVKAVEKLNPIFEAQVLTYLKLTGIRLGFLINLNPRLIKDGIKRLVL